MAASPIIITHVTITRFGPFEEWSVPMRPDLNIVFGANASGKSQFVGAVLFGLIGKRGSGVTFRPGAKETSEVTIEVNQGGTLLEFRTSATPMAGGQATVRREVLRGSPVEVAIFDATCAKARERFVLAEGDRNCPDERLLRPAIDLLMEFGGSESWLSELSPRDRWNHLGSARREVFRLAALAVRVEQEPSFVPLFLDSLFRSVDDDAHVLLERLIERITRFSQVFYLDYSSTIFRGHERCGLPPNRGAVSAAAYGYDGHAFRWTAKRPAGDSGRRSRKPQYMSVFISYGGPDEKEASAINDALKSEGVRTFLFKDDGIPGQKIHRMMSDGVNDFDRVLLVCSSSALKRPGVLNEIEQVLARESREGGKSILIPITLDDHVFDGWDSASKDVIRTIRDRVIGDFKGVFLDSTLLNISIGKVLRALKK